MLPIVTTGIPQNSSMFSEKSPAYDVDFKPSH